MSLGSVILLVNAAATWVMVGVIWFVQAVHYPLFANYGRPEFARTMAAHQTRTGRVVTGPMLVELATALALLVVRPAAVPAWQAWVGAGLVGVWGLSTALVQIPAHDRLGAAGFDADVCRRLVAGNRVRTAAWTARGVLCGVMLAEVMSIT